MADLNSKRPWRRLKDPIACSKCGTEFIRGYHSQTRCPSCRRTWHKLTEKDCAGCGGRFKPLRHDQKYCGIQCSAAAIRRRRMARKPCVCVVCAKEYTPKRADRTTCCSRECGFELRRIKAKKAAEAKAKQCKAVLHGKHCRQCGKRFFTKNPTTAYCSDDCRRASRSIAKSSYACRHCGKGFKPARLSGGPPAYCSHACRSQARREASRRYRKRYGNKARRRARYYGVPYEPVNVIRVFDRDGWRCQICGKATPSERRGTRYPNAPELDHRIPLSLGGTHTYDNVQCACRACNILKGNRAETGQLPLLVA